MAAEPPPRHKRITPNLWDHVEEIAVFDDASQDHTSR